MFKFMEVMWFFAIDNFVYLSLLLKVPLGVTFWNENKLDEMCKILEELRYNKCYIHVYKQACLF